MTQDPAELARRLRALTARRTGLAVCLWGEPGIGKTYRAQALLRETPCRSLSLPARAPLSELACRLPLPTRLPPWAGRVFERLRQGEPADGAGTVDALGAALAGLAPFVLHLEDLHEAGPGELNLAETLARLTARTRGVGLLVTSRAPAPDPFENVRLQPLEAWASAALLEAEAGAALPGPALDWVFGRAVGNPLFTLEYFRLLARQGHLWNDGQRWRWRAPLPDLMPLTVEALIERALQEAVGAGRLDTGGLGTQELGEVVGAKAMLPPEAERALLVAATGLSPQELDAAERELERRGVLARGHFAHPLYREVGLRNFGRGRREAARRVLAALGHDPERAAELVDGAQLERTEALDVLERGALAAAAAGRTAGAARLWARAAGHARGDDQARLALRAARALETTDPPEALRLATLAAELRPGDMETALYLAGRLVQRSRKLADADEVLGRLPEEARTSPTWTAWQINFLMVSGRYREALDLWESRPELRGELDPATCYTVSACLVHTGQPARAAALARRGLDLEGLTPTQRASLLNVVSISSAFLGQPEEAEVHLAAALALAREHGLSLLLGGLLQNRAKNLGRTERFADALDSARESLEAYAEAGDSLRHANAGVLVAGLLTEFGRHDEAETLMLDSLGVLERQGPSRFLVVAQITLVTLYLDWQPPHGPVLALKLAGDALAGARRLGPASSITAFALAGLARAEAESGNPGAALAHAREAVEIAREAADESTFLAFAALAAAHAAGGQPEVARGALAQALSVANAGGFAMDAHRLALEAARLAGDVAAAREECAWFEARGLLGGVKLAHRAFPGLVDSAPAPAAGSAPRLEVLGGMRFGPPGQALPVRGRKRRELLAVLLEARLRGRPEVARLELLDAVYPGSDEGQAAASLKELVHVTRAALGQGVIQTGEGGYALGEVGSDAARFLETGDTRLWRGPYLQDAPLERRDEVVADALHLALHARTEASLEADPQEGARTARLLLEADPYDTRALRLCLRALRAAGNHRSLARLYADARTRMSEVGENLPERWADFLTTQPA